MADTLDDRLARILPGGKGVWVPMDHGISGYPEAGLESMDSLVEAVISGGANAIVVAVRRSTCSFKELDVRDRKSACARGTRCMADHHPAASKRLV